MKHYYGSENQSQNCRAISGLLSRERDLTRYEIFENKTSSTLQRSSQGDKGLSPYRSGPKLVGFFNEFGILTMRCIGFPARSYFTEDCIRQFNDTPTSEKNNSALR